jgi:hypothetical protein
VCKLCGQGIPYHGRRDLVQFIASAGRELERAFESTSRLADTALAVAERMRHVAAFARGQCAGCDEVQNQYAAAIERDAKRQGSSDGNTD